MNSNNINKLISSFKNCYCLDVEYFTFTLRYWLCNSKKYLVRILTKKKVAFSWSIFFLFFQHLFFFLTLFLKVPHLTTIVIFDILYSSRLWYTISIVYIWSHSLDLYFITVNSSAHYNIINLSSLHCFYTYFSLSEL